MGVSLARVFECSKLTILVRGCAFLPRYLTIVW